MNKIIIILGLLMMVGFVGCGGTDTDTTSGGGGGTTFDTNLYDTWAYADGFDLTFVQEFSSPNNYRVYFVSIYEQCEVLATGTARTENDNLLFFTRKDGEVTSEACKTFFGIPSPDPNIGIENTNSSSYSVNPGVTLTFNLTGLTLFMEPVTVDWSLLPQASTISYLKEGVFGFGNIFGTDQIGEASRKLEVIPGWQR